jgi:hypothetical protein
MATASPGAGYLTTSLSCGGPNEQLDNGPNACGKSRKLAEQLAGAKRGHRRYELYIRGESGDPMRAIVASYARTETNVIAVRIKMANGDTKHFRDGDHGTAVLLYGRNDEMRPKPNPFEPGYVLQDRPAKWY